MEKIQFIKKLKRLYNDLYPFEEDYYMDAININVGWQQLICNVSESIVGYLIGNNISDVKVFKIKKDKFYLTFQLTNVDDNIKYIIEEAKQASLKVCESCGDTNVVLFMGGRKISLCQKCETKELIFNTLL
jgi:hypothetical protein